MFGLTGLQLWLAKIALAVLAVAAALGGGYFWGWSNTNETWKLRTAAQAAQAAEESFELRKQIDSIRKVADDERQIRDDRINALLGELRNRPERLPVPARSTCTGTTGSELARPDAEFLAGEAAYCRGLEIDLRELWQKYEAGRQRLEDFNRQVSK